VKAHIVNRIVEHMVMLSYMIKFADAEPNTLRTEQIDKLDCLGKDGSVWCIPVEQCRYKPLQVCSNQF
jgi:hypothetical protein